MSTKESLDPSGLHSNEVLAITLAVLFVCMLWPLDYGLAYWLKFNDEVVDARLWDRYGNELEKAGITDINANRFFFSTVGYVLYREGDEVHRATLNYDSAYDVPNASIDVHDDALTYRGGDNRSKTGNSTKYDYHFEKAGRMIRYALHVVEEDRANRARWGK